MGLATPEFVTGGTVASGRWTVDRSGKFYLGAMVFATGATDGSNLQVNVYRNGVNLGAMGAVHSGSTRALVCHATRLFSASAGDYFEFYTVYFTAGTAATTNTAGWTFGFMEGR